MIGERLKHAFVGNEAWVLSYREECFDQIGLKASQKVPLFNGALECEFRKYEIFDGKYKEFKSQEEGEEKKESATEQTPRFRERKEFKPRREGEFKPRRDGESRPRREGEYKPRREGGDFKGGDERDRKPRGEFRGYYVMGSVLGFLLYRCTLGCVTVPLLGRVLAGIFGSLRRLFRPLFHGVVRICTPLHRKFGHFAKLFRKASFFSHLPLQRDRKMLYNDSGILKRKAALSWQRKQKRKKSGHA